MNCQNFLNFVPTDYPSWRKDKNIPSVSRMIDDITSYASMWSDMNKESKLVKTVKKDMYLQFLFGIQQGEDIGVSDMETFEQIAFYTNDTEEKESRKRARSDEDEVKTSKRPHLTEATVSSVEKNFLSSDNDTNADSGNDNNQESLPNSLEAVEYIDVDHNQHDHKKNIEARNLLRGYRYLISLVKEFKSSELQSNYLQILEVEACIDKCHKILMEDLIEKDKTAPGVYSILPRTAEFNGVTYHYPSYKTTRIAFCAVDTIVMRYNLMVEEIAKETKEKEKIELSLKCASVLLFAFLMLHPFSDGNGRLARLLCNHCLMGFCPFPTAIYNMFSKSIRKDYLTAIVNARKNLTVSLDR